MRRRRVNFKHVFLPYRQPLAISRGVVYGADVIEVSIEEEGVRGRGEACPSARYGESADSVSATVETIRADLERGLDRIALQARLPRGAARNAIDCALWDLECKRTGKRVWELVGITPPIAMLCTQTISLGSPEVMAAQAELAGSPLLKLKLGGAGDMERVAAVRAAAPAARLIVDANEAWTIAQLESFPERLEQLGVELIEQPLPAGRDLALGHIECPIPIAADESFHDSSMVDDMLGKYQLVNIKLDKTGGLTEALRTKQALEKVGLQVIVGCMGGSSRAMAPAMVVAGGAAVVDLDGPLLLVRDCEMALQYRGGIIAPYGPDLWG